MGKISSIVFGALAGASAALFVTSKKGKELTVKVTDWLNDYAEQPHEIKEKVVDFSNQTIKGVKSTVEQYRVDGGKLAENIKDGVQGAVDFSRTKWQETKERLQNKTTEQPSSDDIIIDLTNQSDHTK